MIIASSSMRWAHPRSNPLDSFPHRLDTGEIMGAARSSAAVPCFPHGAARWLFLVATQSPWLFFPGERHTLVSRVHVEFDDAISSEDRTAFWEECARCRADRFADVHVDEDAGCVTIPESI